MSLRLEHHDDGSCRLSGQHTCVEAAIGSPVIAGEVICRAVASRQDAYRTQLGGLDGSVTGQRWSDKGLDVTEEFFSSEDGTLSAMRVVITNRGDIPVTIDRLYPWRVEGSMVVGGGSLDSWRVVRMSRHKNDVPGCYRPSRDDADLEDAAIDSIEIPAGGGAGGLDRDLAGEQRLGIHSEPCIFIKNTAKEGAEGLMLGVLGQLNHLTSIHLVSDASRTALAHLEVEAEFDGVEIDPEESIATHWLVFFESVRDRDALVRFEDLFAREYDIPWPSRPAPSIYCSWYFYGQTLTEEDLAENLEALKRHRVPMDAFMIDHGWMDSFGTWNANARWPSGMKHAADMIRDAGYEPGIWTCPFVVTADSPILQMYPELPVRNADGKPYPFGYATQTAYSVDPSSPSAAEYFREFLGRLKGWGFRYHKMDFIRALVTSDNMVFHDRKMNRARVARLGLSLVREALGPECYVFACGGLYQGSAGLADSVRSGRDTRGMWGPTEEWSTVNPMLLTIKQNAFRNQTNRLWHTDPDAAMLRRRDTPFREHSCGSLSVGLLTDEEAFTVTVNQYLGGGVTCLSERFSELDKDRRELYRHVIPAFGPPAEPLDYETPRCPTLFLTPIRPECTALGNWWTLTVGNWEEEEVSRTVDLGRLRLPSDVARLAVFEFRTQEFLGIYDRDDSVTLQIPPHGVRVLRLAPWQDAPLIVGTNLHISGGGCELSEVEVKDGRITGHVVSEWDYPVKISAVFPTTDGVDVRSVTCRAGEVFSL